MKRLSIYVNTNIGIKLYHYNELCWAQNNDESNIIFRGFLRFNKDEVSQLAPKLYLYSHNFGLVEIIPRTLSK